MSYEDVEPGTEREVGRNLYGPGTRTVVRRDRDLVTPSGTIRAGVEIITYADDGRILVADKNVDELLGGGHMTAPDPSLSFPTDRECWHPWHEVDYSMAVKDELAFRKKYGTWLEGCMDCPACGSSDQRERRLVTVVYGIGDLCEVRP